MERLLILDSNSLMNRAFYAIPLLTNNEGLHTNALLGFTTMLLKMKEELNPDYIVATFDRKAPTFRHVEYVEYKAGRKKMPPELAEQFPVIKEMLKLMSINIFEIDGYEADDLIGTLSKFAEGQGIEVYIVTGDRDALQLASDTTKVVITKKGITEKEIYDKARMIEEFGVTPTQFIDVKGLMGDTSDNIPGVPGVGEKTAYKLIQTYGSVEDVLRSIDDISGKKLKENLTQYSEQAVLSKKLATIIRDVPIEMDIDDIKSKESLDIEGLRNLFFKLQFKSLLDKLPKSSEGEAEEKIDYTVIEDKDSLEKLCNRLKKDKTIHLLAKVVNESKYSEIDVEKLVVANEKEVNVLNLSSIKEHINLLKPILECEEINKVVYDVKNIYTCFWKHEIDIKNVACDIKIAAYLLDSSKGNYDIRTLVNEYLHKDYNGEEEDILAKEGYYIKSLYNIINEKIKENSMEHLMNDIELPLTKVLASMETLGFRVNKEMLDDLSVKFNSEIGLIQNEIYDMAEEKFNVNSPKQLGKILFEKLDLPVIKKTKTGYSTNAEVLEALSDKHPIIDKITYFRQLSKIYSTYIEGLKAVIDKDGKIHSSFNQTVTTTGRLSSTEPNLQNIPIKYEMGREIRKVFIPEDDSILLSADYSQIELRVLAHIANDENLIEAFKNHSDIHTKTASEVFGVPLEEVNSIMRSRAKAVNFGIVYGISDFSLAKDLNIAKNEAKKYMDTYFERYPNVQNYLKDIIEEAKKNGYVNTIVNRRRFIPEINASNKIVKSFGERLAMNTPIQGSAADIIKLAMIRVYDELKKQGLKSTLILQVHDELILNVKKDELHRVEAIVKEQMEEVMDLKVALEVDMNIGESWYEAK